MEIVYDFFLFCGSIMDSLIDKILRERRLLLFSLKCPCGPKNKTIEDGGITVDF